MEDIKQRIGKNIRRTRLAKSLTQEELAELAGLHFTYIGSVERGERNISVVNLEKIAKALAVETQNLLVKK